MGLVPIPPTGRCCLLVFPWAARPFVLVVINLAASSHLQRDDWSLVPFTCRYFRQVRAALFLLRGIKPPSTDQSTSRRPCPPPPAGAVMPTLSPRPPSAQLTDFKGLRTGSVSGSVSGRHLAGVIRAGGAGRGPTLMVFTDCQSPFDNTTALWCAHRQWGYVIKTEWHCRRLPQKAVGAIYERCGALCEV